MTQKGMGVFPWKLDMWVEHGPVYTELNFGRSQLRLGVRVGEPAALR